MKKIKIFCLPSHLTKEKTTGVDFARMIQPMSHLNGYKNIEVQIYDPKIEEKHNNPLEWIDVMKNIDIFYFNYINNPWGFAAMGMMARKYGVTMIMDFDDSLWHIKPDNPAYSAWKKGEAGIGNFTSICNEVDYITCTNDYLKHVIMNNTNKTSDKIKVFPNYVDFKLYKNKLPFKDDSQINLMHFGSTTHFIDLQDHEFMQGVDRIMKEYPNVNLMFVGAFVSYFRNKWGHRYQNLFGHEDIYGWISEKFPELLSKADILITPLITDIYNKCKSNIKYLEASTAGKTGVWQGIRQYEIIPKNCGFLAYKANDWYRNIKKLIEDKELRRKMGENAYNDVKKNWQIQDHLQDYVDFFEEILLDKTNSLVI